jgi:hypothetical protein
MTDTAIATSAVPSGATLLSILASARMASRIERAADLDMTTVTHDAIVDAVHAMNRAAEVFEGLAAICKSGSRKLEVAAWSEQSGPAH